MATFANIFLIKMDLKETIRQDSAKAWMLAARPKTLTGAAVPVMIGLALAYTDSAESGTAFNWTAAALCFLFAMAMQVDANFINDYFDFIKGTDDADKRLGPRRACAQGWVKPSSMRFAIAITTLAACASLFLLGGGVIHDFALTMLIGVLVGTLSSIFVSAPLLLRPDVPVCPLSFPRKRATSPSNRRHSAK